MWVALLRKVRGMDIAARIAGSEDRLRELIERHLQETVDLEGHVDRVERYREFEPQQTDVQVSDVVLNVEEDGDLACRVDFTAQVEVRVALAGQDDRGEHLLTPTEVRIGRVAGAVSVEVAVEVAEVEEPYYEP
jgi:hypothetical protein